MNPFVDAARLLAMLAGLGSQFGGPNGPQVNFGSGEYLASSVTSMGADAMGAGLMARHIAKVQYAKYLGRKAGISSGRIDKALNTAGEKLKGASIIMTTLAIVDVLELTTGFGPPDDGDELRASSQQFTTVHAQLRSAVPDEHWQGSASGAYADLDTALQNIAQTMADLDLELADLVKDQSEWVTHMRLGFGILKDLLIAAFFIELAIRTFVPPPANLAAALTFAIAVCVTAMVAATGFLTTLLTFSILNGQKAQNLTTQYQELATAAKPRSGASVQTAVAAAVESTISSFETISSSTSDTPAMTEVSKSASVASSSGTNGLP